MTIRPIEIADALRSLAPTATWSCENDDYNKIQWFSEDITKPTLEEVETEIARLTQEAELVAYRSLREKEYPDFRDYLDGVVKGDTLQIQDYIDRCLAVKAKYPKPGK